MSTGVTARDIVSVCLLTLASSAAYFAAGVRFDATPFPSYIQFIDAELLNERLLESIWYSHAHPPGLNLLVGVAYRVFGDAAPTFLSLLFHGFGLATKLQEFELSPNGLVANIVSFNVGVEIGQGLALSAILIALSYWRMHRSFINHAFAANAIVMACGFLLVGYQLSGYVLEGQ